MADDVQAPAPGNPLTALLAVATAVLAVAVAVLGWWCIFKPPVVCPGEQEIAEAVSKRLQEDGYLKRATFDSRMSELEQSVASRLATAEFNNRIDRLEQDLRNACCVDAPAVQPRIQVVFENARLQAGAAGDQPLLERLTENSRGIALTRQQTAELDRFAEALLACATVAPVRLKIQGYSSTREFMDGQDRPMDESGALNVKAANLRAEVVALRLRKPGIEVLHVPWKKYGDMRRPFLDSHEAIRSADQELLNRVVLVEVQDAGGCNVEAAGGGVAG